MFVTTKHPLVGGGTPSLLKVMPQELSEHNMLLNFSTLAQVSSVCCHQREKRQMLKAGGDTGDLRNSDPGYF